MKTEPESKHDQTLSKETDSLGVEYSIFDRYYSRRDTLDLMGNVRGRRILDAGCGTGKYALDLSQAGARVTGIDNNTSALGRAREFAGENAEFYNADVRTSLSFLGYHSFDAVLCSLVLHYIEDWTKPLAEFRELLVPNGRFVISVHHPFSDYFDAGSKDYYQRESWYSDAHDHPFWRRSLEQTLAAIVSAGFALDIIREPKPISAWRNNTDLPRLLVIRAFLR
jgi:ubiquinone/menaquinone biosynthesis C-methylase UbiE